MLTDSRVLILIEDDRFAQHLQYAFAQLLFSLGLEPVVEPYAPSLWQQRHGYVISYGRELPCLEARGHIHIYSSDLFTDGYLKQGSLPTLPLDEWRGIPILYSGEGEPKVFFRRDGTAIETNIDIAAGCFFMLTRYEEMLIDTRDRFLRFPASASIAAKAGLLHRPIVNEYIVLLREWLQGLGVPLSEPDPWGDNQFAVCCTHDVDRLRLFNRPRQILGALLRPLLKADTSRFLRIIGDLFGAATGRSDDPFDTFDDMLRVEKELGVTATYYVMSGGTSRRYDNRYRLSEAAKIVRDILATGCEVGLHGSFNSFRSLPLLRSERERLQARLGEEIHGNRQHYLRWETPLTARILDEAGFIYDTTLGYADQVGFRCGTCFPFQLFDLQQGRVLGVWELPLAVMDGTLYAQSRGSSEAMIESLRVLVNAAEKFRGVLVMLWHNSSFYDAERPGLWAVYEQSLREAVARGAFCRSAQEVIAAWTQQGISTP